MDKVCYASVVGSLMYDMVCNRLYITQVVSRFINNLGTGNWEVVKWLLIKYLRGTSN